MKCFDRFGHIGLDYSGQNRFGKFWIDLNRV